MAKKNLLIADGDTNYAQNLERYLRNNHSDKYFVNSLFDQEDIISFDEHSERKIDILLITPELFGDRIKKCASVIMILSGGAIPIHLEAYPVILKYQSGEAIVQSIIKKYVECVPHEFDVSDLAGQCEITGVFSPVGGSGKTTIAAAMARLYAMRHKTLFFSVEQLQYTEQIFAGGSNYDMSDFLYYVHKKDKDIIPNLNKMLIRDEHTGVAFLNSPQCFMDINNIDSEKWVAFFMAIASYGLVNSMVIDLGSFLSESVIEMISACKRVVVPVLDDRMSLMKVNRLIHDLLKMDREVVMRKFVYVLNKYNGTQPHNEIEIFKTLVLDESNALEAIGGDAITQRPFWRELIEFVGLLERVKNNG